MDELLALRESVNRDALCEIRERVLRLLAETPADLKLLIPELAVHTSPRELVEAKMLLAFLEACDREFQLLRASTEFHLEPRETTGSLQ